MTSGRHAEESRLSLVARTAVLCALVLAVLGLCEAGARLVPEPDGFQSRVRRFGDRMVLSDPVLGHRLAPSREAVIGGISYRTSSLGTRGGDLPIIVGSSRHSRRWTVTEGTSAASKTSHSAGQRQRLLILGDSVAMGWGVAEDESYPSRLAAALRESGHEMDVINGAVLGYGTRDQARWLAEIGPLVMPDILLLGYFPNDPEPHESATRMPGPTWSRLWRLVAPRVLAVGVVLGLRPTLEQYYAALHATDGPDWPPTARALEEIAAWCVAHESRCGIHLLPDLTALPFRLGAVHAQVAEEARRHGLPVLDLAPLLADLQGDPRRLWVQPDDPHPNSEMHARYAQALHAWLMESGILSGD